MALVKCPKCGAMVSESSSFCSQCGNRLSFENTENSFQESIVKNDNPMVAAPVSKKNRKGLTVLSIIFAILVLGGAALYFLVLQPRKEAKKLEGLLDNEEWSEAIAFINQSGKEKYKVHLSDCYYNLGKEQMSDKNWEEAVESLTLSDEADKDVLLNECYKHIKSDYSFQEVFEECIEYRFSEEAEDVDISDIYKAELEKLKPFTSAEFHSSNLKELVQKYYKALELGYNYYIDDYDNYDDEDWRESNSTRISVIYQLITDNGFFADNEEVKNYYSELSKEFPLRMKAERDLEDQLNNGFENIFSMNDNGDVLFTFQNNQDFNISVHVDLYYDYENGEEEGYYWDYTRVKAHSSFTLQLPNTDDEKGSWTWDLYFNVNDIVD